MRRGPKDPPQLASPHGEVRGDFATTPKREPNKAGCLPEEAERLLNDLAALGHLRIEGLMTMGPLVEDPGRIRQAFRETRALFDRLSGIRLPGVELRQLSMGMSSSYPLAIAEGATQVRIGSLLFGPR